MNIVVLLKRTFDTEEKIDIDQQTISEDGVEFIINPYDEYAVEEAIRIKEELGGEVTLISVGCTEMQKEIRTALAMGADKGILVDLEDMTVDEHSLSHIIAAVIQKQEVDLILGGNVSIDNAAGQVAARVAELLDIPQVTIITKLHVEETQVTVERDVEGDVEVIETTLPAVFTAQQGLNEPRYPSLPGIMKAKKKPLDVLTINDLDLEPSNITPKSEQVGLFLPPEKERGEILSGEKEDQVRELVQRLRNEAKVI